MAKESDQILQSQTFSTEFETREKASLSKEYLKTEEVVPQTSSPCLFTLGYEGLSIDAYLKFLLPSDIAVLVDVRKNPLSRKYGFSKQQLIQATSLAGLAYQHIPDLGIPSSLRQDLENEADYQQLFDNYATTLLPKQKAAIEQVKYLLAKKKRIVLMCFEANPQFCHRHKIVEYLQNDPAFQTPTCHLQKDHISLKPPINKLIGKDVRRQIHQNGLYITI